VRVDACTCVCVCACMCVRVCTLHSVSDIPQELNACARVSGFVCV